MNKNEEECNKLEEEVVRLQAIVYKLNKNLNSSLVLYNILSFQISLGDKIGLGYEGTSSSKEGTSTNSLKEEIKGELKNVTTLRNFLMFPRHPRLAMD